MTTPNVSRIDTTAVIGRSRSPWLLVAAAVGFVGPNGLFAFSLSPHWRLNATDASRP